MAPHHLRMPNLGIDDQPIRLSVWFVRPGKCIAAGERVAEILAGPATVDLPSPVDGTLIETLVNEDEPVQTGQILALIEIDS
jgi:pyruvate/2-oxoglutarate dehydrogenase complex dihydrolipoamide acyltransferase (E2) component